MSTDFPTQRPKKLAAHVLLAITALALSACAGDRRVIGGVPYPAQPERVELLDVQVFREDGGVTLAFTNTSARAFGPSRLWLNMWFSREIPGLAIGETVRTPIGSFKDEHGDAMRAGGFFATRAAEPIALAELESGGKLYRLVYVREE